MRKTLIALLLVCLLLLPATAMAAGSSVARIGSTEYATLDAAVKAAKNGETIVVLQDCTTDAGLNLSKDLTIQGAEGVQPTITFTKYGIALWKKILSFKDCNIVMNKVASTPYTAEWDKMTICAQTDSTINLDHVNMIMDGDPENTGTLLNKHAIYFCGSDELNMNSSNLIIKNYVQDALEWDGATPGYNGSDPSKYHITMKDSTYLSDHNRSGFTGTFTVRTDHSKVDVINSHGNGSNGSRFYFTDSVVNFNDNGSHGLSASVLEAVRTPVTANNNGRYGIISNFTKFEDSKIQANDNGYNGLRAGTRAYSGMCPLYGYNADMEFLRNGYYEETDTWSGVVLRNIEGYFDEDCKLVIRNSANNGLRIDDEYTNFAIKEGADVEIMCNFADAVGGNGKGGGVRVVGGLLTLPHDAKLYNNHADLAGDDIYLTTRNDVMGKIGFGKVGKDWALDGEPDCLHAIDGWYVDTDPSEEGGARWNAHGAPEEIYMVRYNIPSEIVEGPLALKAAHGIIEPPKTGDESNVVLWTVMIAAAACAALVLGKKRSSVR